MRNRKVILTIAYFVLLWGLWETIVWSEKTVRETYFQHVTRKKVATQSRIPEDRRILGVYKPELPYSFRMLRQLEKSLDARFTLISFYQAWGDGSASRFDPREMDQIVSEGGIPMITWEPWVNEFTAGHLKPMPSREERYLADVAKGAYDFYINEWAREAVKWGKPFFLRFAHEVGNTRYPWSANGNRSEDYIRAWWHVRAVFDSLGARNVIWVWCPYEPGKLDFYPGAQQVDWVAMDVFNYGAWAPQEEVQWSSFDRLAGPLYKDLLLLQKPIMVAEAGSVDMGGDRAVWYREMIEQVGGKYTAIKALVFFSNPGDKTLDGRAIDWSLDGSPEVLKEVRDALKHSQFTYVPDYLKRLSAVEVIP